MAPVFTLTTDLIVGSAPPERAGAASAISETSAEFGGALGIAIFGSIGVAVYRAGMAGVIPDDVSAEAAEAARSTLGGAMDIAKNLPAQVGAEMKQAAQAAFIRGLQICAVVSTVGAIVLAVLAALALRHTKPASADTDGSSGEGAEASPTSVTA